MYPDVVKGWGEEGRGGGRREGTVGEHRKYHVAGLTPPHVMSISVPKVVWGGDKTELCASVCTIKRLRNKMFKV